MGTPFKFIRLRRRPRLRAETPKHFGVQARRMAVDECEEDNPPRSCAETMLRRIPPQNMEVPRLRAVTHFGVQARALPLGLHKNLPISVGVDSIFESTFLPPSDPSPRFQMTRGRGGGHRMGNTGRGQNGTGHKENPVPPTSILPHHGGGSYFFAQLWL